MNRRFPLLSICFSLIIFLSACYSPQPVLRQVPYKTSGTWYQCREYVIEEAKNARMVAAYERFEGDKVRGRVYFPATPEAKVNYFFYPVGGEILELRFEQIAIPAK